MVSLLGAINYESTALGVDGCRQKPNLSLVEQTENCLFGFSEISSKWFRARWQVESNLIFHAFAERAGLAMIRRLAKQLIDATMKCIHYRQVLENLISISTQSIIGSGKSGELKNKKPQERRAFWKSIPSGNGKPQLRGWWILTRINKHFCEISLIKAASWWRLSDKFFVWRISRARWQIEEVESSVSGDAQLSKASHDPLIFSPTNNNRLGQQSSDRLGKL